MSEPNPAPADEGAAMSFPQRKEAAELLIRAYAPERYAHLLLSFVSAAGLAGLAGYILTRNANWDTAVLMFGPSGLIAFSQGRVLHIWTQTANILMGVWKGP
jgi:hypothetical protein